MPIKRTSFQDDDKEPTAEEKAEQEAQAKADQEAKEAAEADRKAELEESREARKKAEIESARAQGEAAAILAVADANAKAIELVANAIRQPGGEQAVQLKVAEKAVEAYGRVASDANTTLIVPSNMTEVSALITSAMKMVQSNKV